MKSLLKCNFIFRFGLIGLIFLCSCQGQSNTSQNKDGRAVGEKDKPNVVVIMVDDLGYGDLGCYGATKIKTPNMDQLAQEGRRFTDAHSASAVCSPSRYALITGQYPSRKNYWGPIFLKDPLMIDTTQMTVARLMKNADYSTAVIGKWHLGFGNEYPVDWNKDLKPGPLELGFDYYFGIPVLNSHPPFVYVENQKVLGLTSEDPWFMERKPKPGNLMRNLL